MTLSNKNLFWAIAALAAVILLSSCAPYQARRAPLQYHAVGTASWYGPGFHGRKTANGERYNQNAMTAAHRTLPFGSSIKVKNVSNGKTAVVRINDRGPFVHGRIIDLSKAAAQHIGMMGAGTAPVELASLDHVTKETAKESAAVSDDAVTKKKPSKKGSSRKKFAPPPPPEEAQFERRASEIFNPPDTPANEEFEQQQQEVEEETGMPPEGDRF